MEPRAVARLDEIWRYPVKSMAGGTIERAELGPLGIPADRRWALRNLDSGKIVSAKLPRLGRVTLTLRATLDEATGAVEVHEGDELLGAAGSEALDTALSERLGVPVRMEPATTADEVYDSWWPELEGLALSDVQTDLPMAMGTENGAFVDLAALHLLTTASLRRLAASLPESDVPVARFRPSLLLDTDDEGFVENDWRDRTATLGGARLSITGATPRCVMTTLSQPGLPDDKAVLQQLAQDNRIAMEGFGDFACLGVYAEVLEPGPVVVGDELVLDPA